MKILKYFLIFLVLLWSETSSACRSKAISLEERVEHAEGIYVGYVTGVELFEYEELIKKGENPSTLIYPESYAVRVLVTEVFRGDKRLIISAKTSSGCGSVGAELKDKIVVIVDHRYPDPYALSAEDSLEAVKTILQDRANK